MEGQKNFEDYVSKENISEGVGNCYYDMKTTYYSLPFWFKHIEGNKFEILLNNKE